VALGHVCAVSRGRDTCAASWEVRASFWTLSIASCSVLKPSNGRVRIHGWARSKSVQITEGANPELEAIATENRQSVQAGLARAGTLRQALEELRAREAHQKRGARREAQAKVGGKSRRRRAYRAAVAKMAAMLESWDVEGARRSAPRAHRHYFGVRRRWEALRPARSRSKTLHRRNPAAFGSMVAGACFGATKTDVVCFSLERILEPMAIPDICGNGHLLTPDNLKADHAKRRWRCRRCGRVRAALFRARHRPAA
jgi:hypothetical protein